MSVWLHQSFAELETTFSLCKEQRQIEFEKGFLGLSCTPTGLLNYQWEIENYLLSLNLGFDRTIMKITNNGI